MRAQNRVARFSLFFLQLIFIKSKEPKTEEKIKRFRAQTEGKFNKTYFQKILRAQTEGKINKIYFASKKTKHFCEKI